MCKHGRIGTQCYECYRDLAHEYGHRLLMERRLRERTSVVRPRARESRRPVERDR